MRFFYDANLLVVRKCRRKSHNSWHPQNWSNVETQSQIRVFKEDWFVSQLGINFCFLTFVKIKPEDTSRMITNCFRKDANKIMIPCMSLLWFTYIPNPLTKSGHLPAFKGTHWLSTGFLAPKLQTYSKHHKIMYFLDSNKNLQFTSTMVVPRPCRCQSWKRKDRATTVSMTAPRSSFSRWTSSMMMSLGQQYFWHQFTPYN